MLRILFWNLNKKDLRGYVCEAVKSVSSDVVILIEPYETSDRTLKSLQSDVSRSFFSPLSTIGRFQVFCHSAHLEPSHEAEEAWHALEFITDLTDNFAAEALETVQRSGAEMATAHEAMKQAFLSEKRNTEQDFKDGFGGGIFGMPEPKGYVRRILYHAGVMFSVAESMSRTLVTTTTLPLTLMKAWLIRPRPPLEQVVREWAETFYPDEAQEAYEAFFPPGKGADDSEENSAEKAPQT